MAKNRSVPCSDDFIAVVMDSVSDAVITTDTAGIIRSMNPAAVELTGWTESDAIGRACEEVFHIFPGRSRELVPSPVEQVLATGQATVVAENTVLIARDGEERIISDRAVPVRNAEGAVDAVVLTFRDDSAITRLREESHKTEMHLHKAQSLAGVGSWEIDLKTGAVTASEEAHRIYGTDGSTLSVKEIRKVPLPEYRKNLDLAMDALISRAVPYDEEFQIRRITDGRVYDIHSVAEYDAELGLVIGTLRDITPEKLAERQKDVLIREVHHRVKNNMATVESLLGIQERVSPEAGAILADARSRVRAMMTMYTGLYQSSETEYVALDDFFRRLSNHISESMVTSATGPIRILLDLEPLTVKTKISAPLGILLNELLTNAVKYAVIPVAQTGRTATIHVRLRRKNDRLAELSVKDDGPGLNLPGLPNESTSFGLQLVYVEAQQVDGTVTCEEDGGVSWVITFPVSPESTAESPAKTR